MAGRTPRPPAPRTAADRRDGPVARARLDTGIHRAPAEAKRGRRARSAPPGRRSRGSEPRSRPRPPSTPAAAGPPRGRAASPSAHRPAASCPRPRIPRARPRSGIPAAPSANSFSHPVRARGRGANGRSIGLGPVVPRSTPDRKPQLDCARQLLRPNRPGHPDRQPACSRQLAVEDRPTLQRGLVLHLARVVHRDHPQRDEPAAVLPERGCDRLARRARDPGRQQLGGVLVEDPGRPSIPVTAHHPAGWIGRVVGHDPPRGAPRCSPSGCGGRAPTARSGDRAPADPGRRRSATPPSGPATSHGPAASRARRRRRIIASWRARIASSIAGRSAAPDRSSSVAASAADVRWRCASVSPGTTTTEGGSRQTRVPAPANASSDARSPAATTRPSAIATPSCHPIPRASARASRRGRPPPGPARRSAITFG